MSSISTIDLILTTAAQAWAAAKEAAQAANPDLYEEAENPFLYQEEAGRRWAQLWALVPEAHQAAVAAQRAADAAILAAEFGTDVDPYVGYEPTEEDIAWGAVGCLWECGECRYCRQDRDPDQG